MVMDFGANHATADATGLESSMSDFPGSGRGLVFEIVRISLGLKSPRIRGDAAKYAEFIHKLDLSDYVLLVDSCHVEQSGDWIHLLIIARPKSGAWTVVPISTVRDIHNTVLGAISDAGFSALGSPTDASYEQRWRFVSYVWPTGTRRPLSPDELRKHDPDSEIDEALKRARELESAGRHIVGKLEIYGRQAREAAEAFHRLPVDGSLLSESMTLHSWLEGAHAVEAYSTGVDAIQDRVESLANEISEYSNEVILERDSIVRHGDITLDIDQQSTIRNIAYTILSAGQQVENARASVRNLAGQLVALAQDCRNNARNSRIKLLHQIQNILSRPYFLLSEMVSSVSEDFESLRKIDDSLKSQASLFNSGTNDSFRARSARADFITIQEAIRNMLQAAQTTKDQVLRDFDVVRTIHDDSGSDGFTPGEALRAWIGGPVLSDFEGIDTGVPQAVLESAQSIRDKVQFELDAAESLGRSAAQALDGLADAIARVPWALPAAERLDEVTAARHGALMDNVRWFLNERGHGSWQHLRRTIEMVFDGEGSPELRADQVARRLRLLGYVETDFRRYRWSVAPAVLSPLVARPPAHSRIYGLFGQVNLKFIDELSKVARVEWLPQPQRDGPSSILVTCDEAVDLTSITTIFGVALLNSAEKLVNALPGIVSYTRSILAVDATLNLGLVQSALHRSGRVWTPASVASGQTGFWRLTFGHAQRSETVEVFRDPITGGWYRGEREVLQTRLGLDSPARQQSVQYTSRNDEGVPALRVRREWRWPDLYERALVLSSGQLPVLRGSVLEYQFVPQDIASSLCNKLLIKSHSGISR